MLKHYCTKALFLLGTLALALLLNGQALAQSAVSGFTFEKVFEKAALVASQPYKEPKGLVPAKILNPQITYDEWRDIRFNPASSLWRSENLPFEVQFFHLGLYYDRPVTINIIDGDSVKRVDYDAKLFNYGRNPDISKGLPADLGFAGFRLHYPIKNKDYKDEVAVFLGASYFKGIGSAHQYGLSARGLAIDTAVGRPEEFPWFKEFWLVKPAADASTITVYALLDSPGAAGAYEFLIIPGQQTIMEVRSRLIMRHRVTALGIAPLTSMFLYGEDSKCRKDNDFRPEVHDSDGLSMHSSTGEWLWRPLINPEGRGVVSNSFFMGNPRGFGLMQRDRNFDHYQDLEAHYQDRPSAFITPHGDWGPGEIRLVQIPSDKEINDNIVAFWVPQNQPDPGVPVDFNYTLAWTTASVDLPETGQVVATRRTSGNTEQSARFIIDFEGKELKELEAGAKVSAKVSASEEVDILETQVIKNDITGGWRLVFMVQPKKSDSTLAGLLSGPRRPLTEMRAFLELEGRVLTETWTFGDDL